MSSVKTNSTSFTASTENTKTAVGPSITVKTETAGKIGLFGAISIIIGAIIGVGIFLKNQSVFRNNNGNPVGVLLSWGLVFLIAFATAFSYGEITRVRARTANSGLAGWSERYVGYNFGRFLKIMYPFFYYAIYLFALSMFFAEALYCINPNFISGDMPVIPGETSQNMWALWGVGFGIAIIMLLTNWLNNFAVQKSMSFISPIKFIPVLLVIIFGVWGGVQSNGGLFNPANTGIFGPTDKPYDLQFSAIGVFNSLPAIMFAFDSFLIVGNVASNVKNPKKNIPLSIILSMVICGAFYFLVTISQLLCGYGNPYGIFQMVFQSNPAALTTFTVIMSVFMAISLFGCVTSLSSAFISSTQSAIDEGAIIGSVVMKRIGNKSRNKLTPGFIMSLIIISFWFLVFGILSAALNTDQIFDGLSNIIVVLIFTVYGFVALMSVINRITHKVPTSEVAYQKGQVPLAIIGTIGCFAVPLYQMIYVFIYQVAVDPTAPYTTWGLFYGGNILSTWVAALIFWGGAILFIGWPFLHDLILKGVNKNFKEPLLWQKANVNKKIEVKK